jgi:hypothetical protein
MARTSATVKSKAPLPLDQVNELIAGIYRSNRAMNAAKKACETGKTRLDGLMADLRMRYHELVVDGVPVEALYEGGTEDRVDPQKLKALVGDNGFMSVVSITQKAVIDEFGANTLNKVLTTIARPESLKVRAKR